MDNIYFISAECHQSDREQGYQLASKEIKKKYDHTINTKSFSGSKIDFTKGHQLCHGYNLLYNHIKSVFKNDRKIITIGGDNSISAATIAATNERYMIQQGEYFSSSLKILWIDCNPDLDTFFTSETRNLNDMPVASLLGLTEPSFVNNKLCIRPEQLLYFGLSADSDTSQLNDLGIEYYTDSKISKIGHDIINNVLNDYFGDSPIHVVLDMKVFNKQYAKSVIPVNDNGIDDLIILNLLSKFKNQIVAMDICEFNPYIGTNEDVKKCKNIILKCITNTFSIQEKNINIMNEHTKFLIYRPTIQESDDDYGWYILTGVSNNEKEQIMKSLNDDVTVTIDIDDMECLYTTTTIEEQNNKSYYSTIDMLDYVLFPNEKISMAFELVNSINL
jgi:arginase family enzyme